MKVSCQCLTYNRPELLEEAVECFLKQDFKGEKELIVLNDNPVQVLKFDHPEVVIVNVPKRFRTVGEKRNACVALCSGDVIFPWDDDDISLPWRISLSLSYKGKKRYFKNQRAWVWSHGKLLPRPKPNVYHAMGCWNRNLFEELGGYPFVQSGQDYILEDRFEKSNERCIIELSLEDIFYIYRFAGTGHPHLSSFGRNRGWEEIGRTETARKGVTELKPHWRQDYVDMTREVIEQLN